uniref:Defensin-like cystein-rich peptide n=1 Tax=Torenia fournieri TaxID=68875 RepID=B9ZZZ4_9LAMI|nr:defensin-like cystein-rich peptide [Torenia fournieri]
MQTKYIFALMVLLVLALSSHDANGSLCRSPSQKFKGPCFSDSNCQSVCEGEGFTGGECEGFRRRCFCSKPC